MKRHNIIFLKNIKFFRQLIYYSHTATNIAITISTMIPFIVKTACSSKNDFCGLIVDFAENHTGMDVECEFLKDVSGDYGNGD